MTDIQWEKNSVLAKRVKDHRRGRWKFLVAGVIILGAVAYLLFYSTAIGARYYVTVDDLVNDPGMLGKQARVSGAVDGDPVFFPERNELQFVIANIPNDNDSIKEQGGLAKVLYTAVNSPDTTRLRVVAHDQEIPDLLQHEAQAILTGKLVQENGDYVFYASEITLKCPTRYEEDVPDQVVQ
ncbi:MAG: cytochrome c maturation protein CcmE [Anaerolineae bacterium]|nr:cytochrome c maturation protein CcmE [Anaerolineae bacterium]